MARRLSSPAFIGRSRELAGLLRAADAAADGHATVVLVGGEAGVGKSRLVSELAGNRRARGWIVAEGATIALGTEGLPFEPVVGALRMLGRELGPERLAALAGPSLPDLARLVPELSAGVDQLPLPISQAEWLQVRIFEGLLGLLERAAEAAPVLLVIEDLHWADQSTRDLLAFLARNARERRLLIVATIRTDELHRRHPLVAWLAEAERLPQVERIDLRRFDRAELTELLAGVLGEPPSQGLVDSIAERTDGNAFFAEELAVSAEDNGGNRLPATLREMVLARIAGLSEGATRVVEVAAVAGREVAHGLLADVSGLPGPAMLDAVREVLASHLLVAVADPGEDRYRFRHALVQEAVYDDLLPLDRRQLHGAYAQAIDSAPVAMASRVSRLVELAHHWAAANQPARALRAAIEAGDASRAAFAFAEAATLYGRAIELWDLVPATDRPADRDLGGMFDAASAMEALAGDPSRAVALARRAIEELDRAGSAGRPAAGAERRAGARERLGRAAWLAGDGATSVAALEEAVALLEGGPASVEQARVLAGLAANLMLAGRVRESQPIAERAIEVARRVGARDIEAHALATLGVDRASQAAVGEGIEALEAARVLAIEIGDPSAIGRAHANLGTVREIGGDLEGALRTYEDGIEASRRSGSEQTFGTFLSINAAGELILLGRYREAADLLARTAARGLVPGIATIHHAITRADLLVRTGELEAARRFLEVARAEAASVEDVQFAGDLEATSAELAIAEDDPSAALAAVERGFAMLEHDRLEPRIFAQLATVGLRAAADLAVRARARREARELEAALEAADRILDRFSRSIDGLEPDALASREIAWLGALLRAERGRAEGDRDPAQWLALRAAFEARPTPYLEAYVLWRAADVDEPGATEAAMGTIRAAHEIASRIGAGPLTDRIERLAKRRRISLAREPLPVEAPQATAHPSPAPEPAADPYGLTPREREILALLAEGYTNRQIAEALFISESTAGVHVSNILGKLGVGSRTAAATLAVRLGLAR